jgi:hypothetical protein
VEKIPGHQRQEGWRHVKPLPIDAHVLPELPLDLTETSQTSARKKTQNLQTTTTSGKSYPRNKSSSHCAAEMYLLSEEVSPPLDYLAIPTNPTLPAER